MSQSLRNFIVLARREKCSERHTFCLYFLYSSDCDQNYPNKLNEVVMTRNNGQQKAARDRQEKRAHTKGQYRYPPKRTKGPSPSQRTITSQSSQAHGVIQAPLGLTLWQLGALKKMLYFCACLPEKKEPQTHK